jgi:hypothetical protein
VNWFWAIAPALDRDDLVATADQSAETSTHVWSVPAERSLSHFVSVASFTGWRLALCTPAERPVVVAGAWERHGVCGYDAATGDRVWQRPEIKRVQQVSSAGNSGQLVAVRPNDGALRILDAATGVEVARVRSAQRYWQSRFGPIGVGDAYQQVLLIDNATWTVRGRTPITGFAILAAAFAPDAILISDVADERTSGDVPTISALDLDGRLLWTYRHPPTVNSPALTWDEDADEWVGIRVEVNRRESDALLRWARNGTLLSSIPLAEGGIEYAFLPGGRRLVTGLGAILDTRSGPEVGCLPLSS